MGALARIEAFRDEQLAKLSRPLARKVLTSLKSLLKVSRYSHVVIGISIKKHKRKRRWSRAATSLRRGRSAGYWLPLKAIQNGVRFY